MRSLHELYLILWDEIKDLSWLPGVCSQMYSLVISKSITDREFYVLKSHFNSQKPNNEINSEFLLNETWNGGLFWWNINEDINPVNRKAFIKKMIEITKPKKDENI